MSLKEAVQKEPLANQGNIYCLCINKNYDSYIHSCDVKQIFTTSNLYMYAVLGEIMRRILSEMLAKYPEDVVQKIKTHLPARIDMCMQGWKRKALQENCSL